MGILSKAVGILAIGAAGAAFATRPGPDEARALFRDRLVAQIESGAILPEPSGAGAALLAACQISPAQCARVLEGAVSMQYEASYLWASVRLQAPGLDPLQCTAAFNRLFC